VANERLAFDVLARDHASQTFKKISRSTDDVHKKFGFLATRTHHLSAGMRASFGLVAGALSGIAAITVFKGFINEARESNKVARLTQAAITSTGGAAHVTAKQVSDLATAISNKVGKDDEAIQSGQNMLLTFTNIRNEVGKNNDIFNRASSTLVDMTAALNGGKVTQENMRKQAIQLGKALNDPIKGITALRRVGVSFTDQQTEQIKKLVESGKTLDAQKIILRELGKEFGGAAQATTDPMEKLGVVVGNLKERIGNALLPAFTVLASIIGNKVVPAIENLAEPLERNVTPVMARFVAIVRKDAVPAFQSLGRWITGSLIPSLKNLWETFGPLVVSIGQLALQVGRLAVEWGTKLLAAIKPITEWMKEHKTLLQAITVSVLAVVAALKLYALWQLTVAKATKIWAAAQAVLNAVMAANPIGIIVVAVAALAAGLIYAYKNSETFRKIVDGAFRAVRDIAMAAFNWIKKNWPLLLAILGGPIGLAAAAIIKNFTRIKEIARTVFLFVANIFLDVVASIIGGVAKMVGVFAKLPGPLGKPFKIARDAIKGAEQSVRDLQTRINRTHGKTVTVSVKMQMKNRLKIAAAQGVSLTISGKPIPLAAGGPVRGPGGPTGDKIPAMLSSGEYVVKASAARKLGTRFLDMLNSAKSVGGDPGAAVLRFASGGSVAAAQSFVRAQKGERYVLGGAGPDIWDCSGITGAAYALLRGLGYGQGQRYFTTQSNFGGLGFKRGLGAYTIGVSPAAGHMVGNIGGLSFEAARSGVPVRVGNATSVKSMAQQWFLASLGGVFGSMGSVNLGPGDLRKIMKAIGINWGVRTGRSPITFDRGGWLMPGANLAVNNTGRPERVLPPGGESGITINGGVHLHGVQDVNGLVAELQRYAKRNGGLKIRTV
jgi:hypothetical protein